MDSISGMSAPQDGKKTILIVDDEEGTRNFLSTLIMREGFRVSSTTNGKLALQRILSKQIKFDLILSDIRTPVMSGIELLKELKKSGQDIPFLFMSGQATQDNIQELRALGTTNILIKPLRSKVIIENIKKILSMDVAA